MMNKLIGLMMVLIFAACSKGTPENVNLKISFSHSASKDTSLLVDTKANDGGNWGQTTPTDVSGINCVAVFVNDHTGDPGFCTLADSTTFSANNFVGFFSKNDSASLVVAVNDGVEFRVAALYSATGSCPSVDQFDAVEDQLSEPQHIGLQVVDITPTTNEVVITTDYSSKQSIKDCVDIPGIPNDNGGGEGGPAPDPRCSNTPNTAGFAAGTGTATDPYLICDIGQLQNIPASSADFYILGDDIIATGINFVPINSFMGNFDGQHRAIIDLTISGAGDQGLFGQIIGGSVQNIGFVNASVTGTASYVGILAGQVNNASIQGLKIDGTVVGTTGVGGLIGGVLDNTGAGSNIGGIGGSVSVSGTNQNIGGIVGEISTNSSTSPTLIGQIQLNGSSVGGSGPPTNVGGIVGQINMVTDVVHMADITFEGQINAGGAVGGVIGYVTSTTTNSLDITRSYTHGSVAGGTNVGGIIGLQNTSGAQVVNMSDSFSIANLSGSSAGVILGNSIASQTNITNLYYFDPTATPINCIGNDAGSVGSGCSVVTGPTDFFVSTHPVYAGWDFSNTWEPPQSALPVLYFTIQP